MKSELIERIDRRLKNAANLPETVELLTACRAELERLRWRSVEDELPEKFHRVLVRIEWADSPAVACLDEYGNWKADIEHVSCEGGWDGCVVNSDITNSAVTHWMPIPELSE